MYKHRSAHDTDCLGVVTDRSDCNRLLFLTMVTNFVNGYVYSTHGSEIFARIVFDVKLDFSRHVGVTDLMS